MLGAWRQRSRAFLHSLSSLDGNVWPQYGASVLHGTSQGIIWVAFSLYILSLGIGADVLGGILSAGPLAQAAGSIPAGLLAEHIGFRRSFFIVYGVAGLARLAQFSTPNVPVIAVAAAVAGETR